MNFLSPDLRKDACILSIITIKLLKGDDTFEVNKKVNRTCSDTRLKTDFPRLEGSEGL